MIRVFLTCFSSNDITYLGQAYPAFLDYLKFTHNKKNYNSPALFRIFGCSASARYISLPALPASVSEFQPVLYQRVVFAFQACQFLVGIPSRYLSSSGIIPEDDGRGALAFTRIPAES